MFDIATCYVLMKEVRSTQAAWYQTFLYKHYTMLAVISGNIAELCRVSELKANAVYTSLMPRPRPLTGKRVW